MVLKVASSVNLKPVSMANSDGEEFNVLAQKNENVKCSFAFEVYIVRYIDGYYPYEKITWGELPRFNKVNDVLPHAIRSMLTLKHSMELSLADIDRKHKDST
ncbi:hypothetical protein INT47_003982 [Mucor saturninus]|uniref:Uncharacterized protein n=1 Tax=Mucor saturninus TaxID=64648 RepID=A0A8H7R710_9FUNG|nr:hypothetical protein INT47_003982 [Mucor saturninus]